MMKFRKTMKYNLKNIAMISAIAGGMFAANACGDKKAIEPEKPTKEIEVKFNLENADKILTFEALTNYANDKTIKTIYLVPTGRWNVYTAANITHLRNALQERLNLSQKIMGRGDFPFPWGEATKVPLDSLWIVAHGWTINKR